MCKINSKAEKSYLYIGTALSPIHVGGTSGNVIADMAIQKEPRELLPKIDSTAWKGSVYSNLSKDNNQKRNLLFSDLNLLFFPICSNIQPYVLISSPTQIERFVKFVKIYKIEEMKEFIQKYEENEIKSELDPKKKVCYLGSQPLQNIFIGDYLYEIEDTNERIEEILELLATLIQQPVERIIIIGHNDFVDLVHDELEYITRVKIGEDHVSSEESLFVEEYLPEESVLYGFIKKQPHIGKGKQNETNVNMTKIPKVIQIGKNTTLGKGIMKLERGAVKNGN